MDAELIAQHLSPGSIVFDALENLLTGSGADGSDQLLAISDHCPTVASIEF